MLIELLDASSEVFSDSERTEVQAFIDVGEYGLALETVACIYVEENKQPSHKVISLIEKLTNKMSMESEELVMQFFRIFKN